MRKILGIRRVFFWLYTLLALGVVVLAVRSFWRADEAAWCTWKPKAGTQGVDRRIVIGSNHGGIFLISTLADIPNNTQVDWYGGKPTEVIFRSTPEARVAASAINAAGNSGFAPRPRWLWGGVNLHSESSRSAGNSGTLAAVVVPDWLPLLVLLWPAFVVLRRRRTLRRRRREGLCLYCGYDLRASGAICSECGERRAELRPVVPPPKPLVSRRTMLTACAGIVAASLALAWVVHYSGRPEPAVQFTPGTVLSVDHLPKRVDLELGKGITMRLALIPAGHFTMGSPADEADRQRWGDHETQHEVTISKSFYIGETAVTQEQYEAVMGSNPSEYKGAKNPVETVSWDEATAFCASISKRTGRKVGLPMEAQWEYACRAGTTTPFNTGSVLARDMANYGLWWTYPSNRAGDSREDGPLPVGSFKPNAWGLYDMHGSVWQWCSDLYGDYEKGPATDPTGATTVGLRVLRGGSWISDPWYCRSAYRGRGVPGYRRGGYGFRVAVVAAGVGLH